MREAGKAIIPRPTATLQGLVNAGMAAFYYWHCDPHTTTATLDPEATRRDHEAECVGKL